MEIRQATKQDTDQIRAIWNPIIRDTLTTFTTVEKTNEDIQNLLETKRPFFVATEEKTIQGFATYGPFRNGPGYAKTMELSINLASDSRGKGIGTKLLNELESQARANKIHSLIAGVSSANPAAISFHKTNGYTTVGTLPKVGRKFEQWLDLVLLQKLL